MTEECFKENTKHLSQRPTVAENKVLPYKTPNETMTAVTQFLAFSMEGPHSFIYLFRKVLIIDLDTTNATIAHTKHALNLFYAVFIQM